MSARSFCTALAAFLVAFSAILPAQPDRASQVLAQARTAIGGEARLRAVRTLSVDIAVERKGPISTTFGDNGPDAGTEERVLRWVGTLQMELPDNFLITRPPNLLPSMWGFRGSAVVTDTNIKVVGPVERFAGLLEEYQRDFLRCALVWLLLVPDQYAVTFHDAGEADTAAGRADVIEARGNPNFTARLFIHRQTHRPVMLAYREPPDLPQSKDQKPASSRLSGEPMFTKIEPSPLAKVETRIAFDKYRDDDGILFPHAVIVTEPAASEKWQLSKFKVNGRLKVFEKR